MDVVMEVLSVIGETLLQIFNIAGGAFVLFGVYSWYQLTFGNIG